jgi:hypothetical protein
MGPPIALWAFGHTHHVMDVMRNDTRVVTNAFGYAMQAQVKNFDPSFVVEVVPI